MELSAYLDQPETLIAKLMTSPGPAEYRPTEPCRRKVRLRCAEMSYQSRSGRSESFGRPLWCWQPTQNTGTERSRRQGLYASSSETETVRRSPKRSRPSEKPAPTYLLIC
ncbi:hypothetical protein ACVW1C_007641 [Bradyrhizobium sp. USDA 4011]